VPRLIACAVVLLVASGCRSDETPVGPGREQIVVHSVLDPGRFEQRVLLERLLTGRAGNTARIPFDSLDPIASHGGVPLTEATVVIYGPSGDSVIAIERDVESGARGTGMYEFGNSVPDPAFPGDPALEIAGGRTYRLRVTTADGRVLTASTTVPDAPSIPSAAVDAFNRDRQSLFLFWNATRNTARYLITASSPRGAFSIFVDSVEFLVSGRLKNTSLESQADVFVPGFTQDVTVAAVDANYHDYYRSENDPFTGRGLLVHVVGGLGVFGSLVKLRELRLRVTADIDHRLEGRYSRESGSGPSVIDLYVAGAGGARAELSGNYRSSGSELPGVLGTLNGDSVVLALLRGQRARDTALVIEGRFDSGFLRGRIRGGGDVVYRLLELP